MTRYPSGVPVGTPYGQLAFDEHGDSLGIFLDQLSDFSTPQPMSFYEALFRSGPVAYYDQGKDLQVKLYSLRLVSTKKHTRVRQGLIRSIGGTPAWINIEHYRVGGAPA